MDFAKRLLSGSTDGKSIKVTGTDSGSADTIHTAIAGSSGFDEVWLWAFNNDTTTRTLMILVDGQETAAVGITAKTGLFVILPGIPVNNTKLVKAYASVANMIYISGYVNRIS